MYNLESFPKFSVMSLPTSPPCGLYGRNSTTFFAHASSEFQVVTSTSQKWCNSRPITRSTMISWAIWLLMRHTSTCLKLTTGKLPYRAFFYSFSAGTKHDMHMMAKYLMTWHCEHESFDCLSLARINFEKIKNGEIVLDDIRKGFSFDKIWWFR